MVQLLGGQETIPGDPAHVMDISPLDVATMTQKGWLSPAESDILIDERRREQAIQENRERLAKMKWEAATAQETYYEKGGTGYGTTPGGPDVYYFDIPLIGSEDPPVYEKGTFFGADLGKDNLLLYGALAIGALALLRR